MKKEISFFFPIAKQPSAKKGIFFSQLGLHKKGNNLGVIYLFRMVWENVFYILNANVKYAIFLYAEEIVVFVKITISMWLSELI